MTDDNTRAPLYFVHVPKTAGTSFREALAGYFGKSKGCYDYGDNPITSDIIRKHIYQNLDMWKMQQAFRANGSQYLAGHFGIQKYLHLFGIKNSIAFVREPLQRLLSEYRHFRNFQGYDKSMVEFIQEKRFQNRQHRHLAGSRLALAGFVGLTETYADSLQYINRTYGLELPEMSENTYRNNLTDTHEEDPEIEELVRRLNPLDYDIYDQAKRLQDLRFALERRNLPYTRGQIINIVGKGVNAWAVRDDDEEPVTLSIRVNDDEVAKGQAVDIRPHLASFQAGLGGHVGLLSKLPKLRAGDSVRCIVDDTGQELLGSPFLVEQKHL